MTEQERKRKAAELAARAKDLQRRMSEQAVTTQFRKQLEKDDPKAFSALAKYNVLSYRKGLSPEQIKDQFTPKERKAFVRSIDARKEFSRKLIK